MKRVLALILAVFTALSLVACGGSGADETTTTVETTEFNSGTCVVRPLFKEEFEGLPIANDKMTEDELRQLVLDYMRMQNSFAWTPSKKFSFVANKNGKFVVVAPGKAYGGCPYIGVRYGSLYNFMNYYDDKTGTVDTDALLGEQQDWTHIIGNMCSSSTIWAWMRVSNSITCGSTYSFLPANNCPSVGNIQIDPTITNLGTNDIDTAELFKHHTAEEMYEAYAQLKPADGIVYLSFGEGAAGHVIMVSSTVVVRDENGKIDPKKSYITFLDQALILKQYKQEDGTTKNTFGNVDETHTFEKLYNAGSLPFTIPEFSGAEPVEKGQISASTDKKSVTVDELLAMQVSANYALTYTQIVVKDSSGKELYKEFVYPQKLKIYTMNPVTFDAMDVTALWQLCNDKNTVEISGRLSNGELLTAYTGTLAKSDVAPTGGTQNNTGTNDGGEGVD